MTTGSFDSPLQDPLDILLWPFFLGVADLSPTAHPGWFSPLRLTVSEERFEVAFVDDTVPEPEPLRPSLAVRLALVAKDGATIVTWWSGARESLAAISISPDGELSLGESVSVADLAGAVIEHLLWEPIDEEAVGPLSASISLIDIDGDQCRRAIDFDLMLEPEDRSQLLAIVNGSEVGFACEDLSDVLQTWAAEPPAAGHVGVFGENGSFLRWAGLEGSEEEAEEITAISTAATLELWALDDDQQIAVWSGPEGTISSRDASDGKEIGFQLEDCGVLGTLLNWLCDRPQVGSPDLVTLELKAMTESGGIVVSTEQYVLGSAGELAELFEEAGDFDEGEAPVGVSGPHALVSHLARALRDAVLSRA